MNNNISFTGIKNIKIAKGFLENKGLCGKPQNVVKISCDLFDDTTGNDLSFYKTQLEKFGNVYKQHFVSDKTPNKIEMFAARFVDTNNLGNMTESNFILNGFHFDNNTDDKIVLPMYTFIAKLSAKISKKPDLSNVQKACVDFFNKAVNDEAVKLIEKM
ncbi:hypothetical protein J6A31_06990 [bacterium]|nr:hypothetical protein [bacterium]